MQRLHSLWPSWSLFTFYSPSDSDVYLRVRFHYYRVTILYRIVATVLVPHSIVLSSVVR